MRHTLCGPLPRHLYVHVDTRFTHKRPEGWAPAVWFGLVSYPARAWGCTVLLESGAIYRNLPPHALAFGGEPQEGWPLEHAQTWDCYGWDWSAVEYPYLRGLDCLAAVGPDRLELPGEYLFSVAPVEDAYSAAPEQAKEFVFVQLDNGRLTIQPTDRVVFRERSFTHSELAFPRGLRRQTEVWASE